MQVIVIGQNRGQNYLDIVEFCSTRGIKLVEEKVSNHQLAQEEICHRCKGLGYLPKDGGIRIACKPCYGTGKLSSVR